jgi:integrase
MRFTQKGIAKLKPGRYRDKETRGLYLQVGPSLTKSWLLRFELNKRERFMGLGSYAVFSMKEARERARKEQQKLADGIDPLEAKKALRAATAREAARAITFEEATQQYYDQQERKWTNRKHAAQFLSTMKTYVYPEIGKLPVAAVDTGLVLKVLEPIWLNKTETASRVRNRIEAVLDWATVRSYRTGENPARWRGYLENVLPARNQIQPTENHAALPYTEIFAFMAALRSRTAIPARALEFLILTATRSGAVNGARWEEIDVGAKVWTVPPSRAGTKIVGNQPRRVPLSGRAIEILNSLPRVAGNPHVFIGETQGSFIGKSMMAKMLARLRPDVTVHGFRSTFKDWAAEQTNYANIVSEAALWHSVSDKVEAAYRRGDLFEKRRRLMNEWAKYCVSDSTGASAKVIAFSR